MTKKPTARQVMLACRSKVPPGLIDIAGMRLGANTDRLRLLTI
jgi:hypothetical protein